MPDYVFVLEQTLGHAAHARNLKRVVAAEPDVKGTFLPLDFEHRLGWQRLPGLGSWSLRASWAARNGLRRILAERTPDALFIHTQVASLLAISEMRRVPTIVSLDATPINFDNVGHAYAHRTAPGAIEAAKMVVNRRSYAAAAGLVTWSRWAAESLREDYAVPDHKIRVIPPGVDLDIFMPADHGAHARVRLLFVGGDLERKGGLDLLQALPALGDRVELDLVTGSEPPPIPAGTTVRVHRGLKPQSPELVRLYREADIFVLPTHADCLPQAVAEAMACALPVISTPVGAIRELVHDRVTGLLVPPGSPAELALALRSLCADPGLLYTLGRAGLELVRREHDAVRNNHAILALMHQVSARSAPEAVPA